MANDVRRIDIKEFRQFGFLQEANRRFFHPLGLALEVVVDEETGSESLGGVWDYRDDPEGILFGEDGIDEEKVERVRKLQHEKSESRLKCLGYIVQPCKEGK